jgi:Domain of unknown function (DUF3331)
MNPIDVKADPWPKLLELLDRCCTRENAESNPAPRTKLIRTQASPGAWSTTRCGPAFCDTEGFRTCVTINVLEVTESSATLGWYDPTRCRYEDQRWNRFKTHRAGVCAMTGALITAGTDVFHPARAPKVPANADAMILACALRCAAAADSAGGAE